MHRFSIACLTAASALAVITTVSAAPIGVANGLHADSTTIEVKGGRGHGRGHGWHGNRGRHLGWYKGRHRGWAHSRHRHWR